MDQTSEAEELLQVLTQLTHHLDLESPEQLARGEGALLRYLALRHNGATAGELRDAMGVGSGRVANALKRLEAKGLITRSPSEEDGRVVLVYLTQAGRSYIMERYRRLLGWTTMLMEELGEEDSREVLRLAHRLLEATDRLRQKSKQSQTTIVSK